MPFKGLETDLNFRRMFAFVSAEIVHLLKFQLAFS